MAAVNKELAKGSITLLVLSLLEQKPMYGYEMIKQAESKTDGVFLFKEGTLYPVLHNLESQGLVESFWSDDDGPRKRKYYRLTSDGLAQLREKQQEWQRFTKAVNNLLGGVVRCVTS